MQVGVSKAPSLKLEVKDLDEALPVAMDGDQGHGLGVTVYSSDSLKPRLGGGGGMASMQLDLLCQARL